MLQIGNSNLVSNSGGGGNLQGVGLGTVVSLGHNLADDDANGLVTATGDQTVVAVSVIDAVLADNGGPTLTHALVPGSHAIDAGDNSLAVDPAPDGVLGSGDDVALITDQRLTGFDRIVDGSVDIGAVELQRPKVEVFIDEPAVGESGLNAVTITVTTDIPVIGDQSSN